MKVCLSTLVFFISFQTHAFVPGLLDQGREMVGLIEKARLCSVDYQASGKLMTFCSGFTLEKDDLSFLKNLTFEGCHQFLKQRGYQVLNLKGDQDEAPISEEVKKDFFNSTKLAWMLHKEKKILFKNGAKRGDCLHEVLHFYQRERGEGPLAPLNRKKAEALLQDHLEKAVLEVEKVEKKGDKKKAQEMANKLKPFIALQREWQKMINWLDEKEIYQAFFDYHELFFNTSGKSSGKKHDQRDWDIALANLVRLKDSLSWDLRERVLYYAQEALNQKYAKVVVPRTIDKNKDEAYYGNLYNQGKISRDDFEEKVIGLRKYRAGQDLLEARRKKDLYKVLQARSALRNFDSEKEDKVFKNPQVNIILQFYKELPMVLVEGEPFILDTGAAESIMPPSFLKKFKESELLLLGSKALQTVVGRTEAAPVVQLLNPLKVGNIGLKGLRFVVSELPIKGVAGLLGMDFFQRINGGSWHWGILDQKLSPWKGPKSNRANQKVDIFKGYLLSGGKGEVDALEFRCGDIKVRLDSGSQVLGDIPQGAKQKSYKDCHQKLKLPSVVNKKLLKAPVASALFSRRVDLNLGHDFIKKLDHLAFDLKRREILLATRKSMGGN